MITKKDAILIAQTFSKAAKFEIDNYAHGDSDKIGMVRGSLFRSLGDFYYDLLPLKVRDQFCDDAKAEDHGNSIGSGRTVFLKIAHDILDK
jgi:hypothetical protein